MTSPSAGNEPEQKQEEGPSSSPAAPSPDGEKKSEPAASPEEMREEELEVDPDDDHMQAERLLNERWVIEDQCRWTIFEDMEDELAYHRRRSKALCCFVRAYTSLREEYDRLQEGGLGLQDAYEQLQDELREAVGDAAYWRELAEARGATVDASSSSTAAPTTGDIQPEAKANTESMLADDEEGCEVPQLPEADVEPNSHAALHREMLKDAQAQVIRWRRMADQRGEEVQRLREQLKDRQPSESPLSNQQSASRRPMASRVFGHSPLGLSRSFSSQSPSSRAYPLAATPPRSATPSKHPAANGGSTMSTNSSFGGDKAVSAVPIKSSIVSGKENFPSCGNASPFQTPPDSPAPSVKSQPAARTRPPEAPVIAGIGRSASEARVSGAGYANNGAIRRGSTTCRGPKFCDDDDDRAPSAAVAALAAPPLRGSESPATNRRILFASAAPARSEVSSSACSGASTPTSSAPGNAPAPARATLQPNVQRRCTGLGRPTRRKQEKPLSSTPASEKAAASDVAAQPGASRHRQSISSCMSPSAKAARRGTVALGQPTRRSSMAPSMQDSPRVGCQTPPHPAYGSRTPPASKLPFRQLAQSFGYSSPSSPPVAKALC